MHCPVLISNSWHLTSWHVLYNIKGLWHQTQFLQFYTLWNDPRQCHYFFNLVTITHRPCRVGMTSVWFFTKFRKWWLLKHTWHSAVWFGQFEHTLVGFGQFGHTLVEFEQFGHTLVGFGQCLDVPQTRQVGFINPPDRWPPSLNPSIGNHLIGHPTNLIATSGAPGQSWAFRLFVFWSKYLVLPKKARERAENKRGRWSRLDPRVAWQVWCDPEQLISPSVCSPGDGAGLTAQ